MRAGRSAASTRPAPSPAVDSPGGREVDAVVAHALLPDPARAPRLPAESSSTREQAFGTWRPGPGQAQARLHAESVYEVYAESV